MNRLDIDYKTLKEITRGSMGKLCENQGITNYAIEQGKDIIKLDRGVYNNLDYYLINKEEFFIKEQKEKLCLLNLLDSIRDNFSLIDFPHTVIYCNDILVGTMSKFYEDGKDFYQILELNKIEKQKRLLKIIDIFRELEKNNLAYIDIHCGNFLLTNDSVKLIDLDDPRFIFITDKISDINYMYRRLLGSIIMNFMLNTSGKIMTTYNYNDILEFMYLNVDSSLYSEINNRLRESNKLLRKSK